MKKAQRVLSYDSRKMDLQLWDISTPGTEIGAYLSLFRNLDSYWGVYEDLETADSTEFPKNHPIGCYCLLCAETRERIELSQTKENTEHLRGLLKQARAGSYAAAKELLWARNKIGHDYERFKIAEVKYEADEGFGAKEKPDAS